MNIFHQSDKLNNQKLSIYLHETIQLQSERTDLSKIPTDQNLLIPSIFKGPDFPPDKVEGQEKKTQIRASQPL